MQSNAILREIGNTEKLMVNGVGGNNNNNGSPANNNIIFHMEDDGLTQLGSVFQSAYQSIVDGGAQVSDFPSTTMRDKAAELMAIFNKVI